MKPTIEIYVTRYCPYCHAALRLLDGKGVDYNRIDVDGDREGPRPYRQSERPTHRPPGLRRWPPYGGYTDIAALDRRGKLDEILAGQAQ